MDEDGQEDEPQSTDNPTRSSCSPAQRDVVREQLSPTAFCNRCEVALRDADALLEHLDNHDAVRDSLDAVAHRGRQSSQHRLRACLKCPGCAQLTGDRESMQFHISSMHFSQTGDWQRHLDNWLVAPADAVATIRRACENDGNVALASAEMSSTSTSVNADLVETSTPRRSRRAISPRTRLRAVRLAKAQGVVLTAMQFAIGTRMLRGWMKAAARGHRQMKKGAKCRVNQVPTTITQRRLEPKPSSHDVVVIEGRHGEGDMLFVPIASNRETNTIMIETEVNASERTRHVQIEGRHENRRKRRGFLPDYLERNSSNRDACGSDASTCMSAITVETMHDEDKEIACGECKPRFAFATDSNRVYRDDDSSMDRRCLRERRRTREVMRNTRTGSDESDRERAEVPVDMNDDETRDDRRVTSHSATSNRDQRCGDSKKTCMTRKKRSSASKTRKNDGRQKTSVGGRRTRKTIVVEDLLGGDEDEDGDCDYDNHVHGQLDGRARNEQRVSIAGSRNRRRKNLLSLNDGDDLARRRQEAGEIDESAINAVANAEKTMFSCDQSALHRSTMATFARRAIQSSMQKVREGGSNRAIVVEHLNLDRDRGGDELRDERVHLQISKRKKNRKNLLRIDDGEDLAQRKAAAVLEARNMAASDRRCAIGAIAVRPLDDQQQQSSQQYTGNRAMREQAFEGDGGESTGADHVADVGTLKCPSVYCSAWFDTEEGLQLHLNDVHPALAAGALGDVMEKLEGLQRRLLNGDASARRRDSMQQLSSRRAGSRAFRNRKMPMADERPSIAGLSAVTLMEMSACAGSSASSLKRPRIPITRMDVFNGTSARTLKVEEGGGGELPTALLADSVFDEDGEESGGSSNRGIAVEERCSEFVKAECDGDMDFCC